MKYKNIVRDVIWNYRTNFNHKLINKSKEFWQRNKNKHKGKRGFIVGNGPSLKISDLNLLKNEITIASNKIYLAFEQTSWRPTYLTVFDRLLWKEIKEEIYNYHNPIILPHDRFPINKKNTIIIKNNGYFKMSQGNGFSNNMIDGLWGGRTVTYNNMQIAVHLGLHPIYLIGCDHYYKEDKPKSEKKNIIINSNTNNHFINNYRKDGQKINYAPIDIMTNAYENAKLVCIKNNTAIINATRGGHLEVFDRVNFKCLF
tara:strand:+ start:1189 stop:1959 length:771 start_codon:yes stop_codon:yes gene_type:complete